MSVAATTPRFKDNVHEALQRRAPAARAAARAAISSPGAPTPRRGCRNSTRCATARATSRTTRSPISISISRPTSARSSRRGGHVHYARDADEAVAIFLGICKARGAKAVTKGKSMISEEIGLNAALEAEGIDGGRDRPRRIYHPAARRGALAHHRAGDPRHPRRRRGRLPPAPPRSARRTATCRSPSSCSARRARSCATSSCPPTSASPAPISSSPRPGPRSSSPTRATATSRRSCPRSMSSSPRSKRSCRRSNDAAQILRVLARSATGQDMSVYTTLSTGPRRAGDPDGPEEYHVVLLDNGRSAMLGGQFEDMLRCIRCGACMNHCPVYHAVGGHAYGWVYPGPMGAVLTPLADRRRRGRPVAQRLDLLRPLRSGLPDAHPAAEADAALARARVRAPPDAAAARATALRLWAFFAKRPTLYRLATDVGDARARPDRPRAAAVSPGCRSPAAGRAAATSPRRRARPSRAAGGRRAGRSQ